MGRFKALAIDEEESRREAVSAILSECGIKVKQRNDRGLEPLLRCMLDRAYNKGYISGIAYCRGLVKNDIRK